ncbi:MAG: hypothetical protein HY584_02880 [Candidatus Omnitrophica bacterium]|nr:hypothetical protein [Candidatus Omnitrophota bacterium]
MKSEELHAILQKGILAPSADNLQPWKFKLAQDHVDLFLDPQRVKNFCDEGLFAPYLSAGALIENIRVASSYTGYWPSPSYFPLKSDPLFVASIFFSPITQKGHAHYAVLEKRNTNRRFYDASRKVDRSIFTKLDKIVESEKGFKLHWFRKNEPSYKKLSRLVGAADQLRFESERLHEEFVQILRLNQSDAQKTSDGLDVKTLEAGPGAPLLFHLLSSWKRLSFLNLFGMSRLFNCYAQLQMWSAQAAGLIVAPSHEPIHYVQGGEVMQKMWHEATVEGLSVQPMEALPIFIDNLNLTEGRDFTASQRARLERLKSEFLSLVGINEQNGLILLFRIGYSRQPSARSLRRPLEEFVL